MKKNRNSKIWQIISEVFLLKAEEIGYYIISIGLILAFTLVVFDGFKTLFYIFTYENLTKGAITIIDKFLIALIF